MRPRIALANEVVLNAKLLAAANEIASKSSPIVKESTQLK